MPKLTLEEKRRQSIYRQLYGKQSYNQQSLPKKPEANISSVKQTFTPSILPTTNNQLIDSKYLKADLLKVAIFSAIAVSIQVFLFIAQRNHLINLY